MKNNFESTDLNNDFVARTYGFKKYYNKKETNNYLIYHTGFTGCNMWIDYKNRRGFVLLTNAIHPKRELNNIFSYRNKILRLYY